MKIAGLTMNDVWAQRVLADRGLETASVEGVNAEIKVLMQSIELAHHGPEQKYRPYLHLHGELSAVLPETDFPYGVNEVTFPSGVGDSVDVFYEFTEEQLADLIAKGYFSPAFATPAGVTGIAWELPTTVDAFVLAPAAEELGPEVANVPVVFVRVHDLGDLQTDLERSGYDLVEYFEDYSLAPAQVTPTVTPERAAPTTAMTFEPLFDEQEQALALAGRDREPAVEPAVQVEEPQADLATQLREAEARIEAEEEAARRERASKEGSAEQIYESRVASPLRKQAESERLEELQRDIARRDAELTRKDENEPATGFSL